MKTVRACTVEYTSTLATFITDSPLPTLYQNKSLFAFTESTLSQHSILLNKIKVYAIKLCQLMHCKHA